MLAGGLSWAACGKPGGDEGPAELDEHVLEGRLDLGPVPGLAGAAVVDVGRVVAVPGVPDDDQGAGSANPFRKLARSVVAATNVSEFVTSAGSTANWLPEATAIADTTPTWPAT